MSANWLIWGRHRELSLFETELISNIFIFSISTTLDLQWKNDLFQSLSFYLYFIEKRLGVRRPLQEVFLFVNFHVLSLMIIVFTLNGFFFSVTSWVHKGTHTGSLAINKNGCGMWWEEGLCAGKNIPALVSHCATLLQAKDGEDGQPLSLTYSLGRREGLVDGNVRGWAQDNHCGAGWMCWSHSF